MVLSPLQIQNYAHAYRVVAPIQVKIDFPTNLRQI